MRPITNSSTITPTTQSLIDGIQATFSVDANAATGDRIRVRASGRMCQVVQLASYGGGLLCLVAYDYRSQDEGPAWVPANQLDITGGIIPATTPGFVHVAFDLYRDTRRGLDYGSIWQQETIDGQPYLVVYTDDDGEVVRSVTASLYAEAQNGPRGDDAGMDVRVDNVPPMGWNVERDEEPRGEQSEALRDEGQGAQEE